MSAMMGRPKHLALTVTVAALRRGARRQRRGPRGPRSRPRCRARPLRRSSPASSPSRPGRRLSIFCADFLRDGDSTPRTRKAIRRAGAEWQDHIRSFFPYVRLAWETLFKTKAGSAAIVDPSIAAAGGLSELSSAEKRGRLSGRSLVFYRQHILLEVFNELFLSNFSF
jgi:hypothetical protein